jgi:alkylhydroperoxidase family enzyme
MDIGSAVSRAAGIEAEKLLALPDYETSPLFSEDERLVLQLADRVAATPPKVDEALYAALAKRFSSEQLVELAAALAWENYRARFNRVFDIASDDFSEGATCAVPAPLMPKPLPRPPTT